MSAPTAKPIDPPPPHRARGRLTGRQRWALDNLAQRYLVGPAPDAWREVFGRTAPLGLEIGFGMGDALVEWAVLRPRQNMVGIEIFRPGIGALLLKLHEAGIGNVRVLEGDAARLLHERFAAASLAEVRIWFPDPWPKRRHHKRRLIQPTFARLLAERLQPGGKLLLATDWADYANWMEQTFAEVGELALMAAARERPVTKFERRGLGLGHGIREFAYRRR